MERIVQNRITNFSMTITKLAIPALRIDMTTQVRLCGGGSGPLDTAAAITSALSVRTEAAATAMLIIRLGFGPALLSNPPQSYPAYLPPPQGGGQGSPGKTGPKGPEQYNGA